METYQPIYDAARQALSGSGARVEEGARQAVAATDLRTAIEEGARQAVLGAMPPALADIIAEAVARAVSDAAIRAAVEAEREACAKVCDDASAQADREARGASGEAWRTAMQHVATAAERTAAAIRARGGDHV